MQFNPKDLLIESGYNTNELKRLETVDISNKSYFSEALDFVSECDSIMDTATKQFYKSLLEADVNDMVAITESFADFKDTVVGIIEKFLKFIKSLFERFITAIMGIVKSDKHIRKHKSKFPLFSTEHEFKIKGYEYTFSPGTPSLVPVEDLQNITTQFYSLGNNSTAAEINAEYQTQTEGLEQYYDTKRAQIIKNGTDQVIYESDFSDELFRVFRNGENSKEEITVTSAVVNAAYNRFDGYENIRKSVTKEKKDIEAKYNELKKQIDDLGKREFKNNDVTMSYTLPATAGQAEKPVTMVGKDKVTATELLFKLHTDKVQRLSDMHSLAFAAKLDALKECFNQDKAILYKALSRLQKVKLLESSVNEGNTIVAQNVFILSCPKRDCDDMFNGHLYKDEFDFDMNDDIDVEDDYDINLPEDDEMNIDDAEFDVPSEPGDEPDEDDEVIHDDEDLAEVEESLFFNYGLDLLVEESIQEMGGRF